MLTKKGRHSTQVCRETVQINASAAQTHANGQLIAHLRSMIDRGETSDLKFICKDEVSVRASRILLLGRSPMLDKMLTNGMQETTALTINMPQISSTVLLSIIEFLYTGDILHYRPENWSTGLEIVSVAHFFLLVDVDKIIQKYLGAEIAGVGTDFRQMAVMLTTAMTFKNLPHDKDPIMLELVNLLDMKWTRTVVACHLSEEALDFILRHSEPTSRAIDLDLRASCLTEYARFRGILLWCVCNSRFAFADEKAKQLVGEATKPAKVPVETNELTYGPVPCVEANELGKGITPSKRGAGPSVQMCKRLKKILSAKDATKLVKGAIPLPEQNKDLRAVEAMFVPTDVATWLSKHNKMIQFLKSNQPLKEAAMRLLLHVDWVRIPATIFLKVVVPLKLIPDSKLADVFQFSSLHSGRCRVERWILRCQWFHDETYEILKEGFTIQKAKRYGGSAMCKLRNCFKFPVCHWDFTVAELAPDIQLGFLCGENTDEATSAWNLQKDCLTALGASRTLEASGVKGKFESRVIRWTGKDSTPSSLAQRIQFKCGEGGHLDGIESSDVRPYFERVEFRYNRITHSCDIAVDRKNLGTVWRNLSGKYIFPVVSFGGSKSGRVHLGTYCGFNYDDD